MLYFTLYYTTCYPSHFTKAGIRLELKYFPLYSYIYVKLGVYGLRDCSAKLVSNMFALVITEVVNSLWQQLNT